MKDEFENGLGDKERAAFRSLAEGAVFRRQEDRVVQALKREGLIRTPASSRWIGGLKLAGMVAALVVAFLGGREFGSDSESAVTSPIETNTQESDRFDQFEDMVAAELLDPTDPSVSPAIPTAGGRVAWTSFEGPSSR